jgi:probable rRNA maturation factor
MKVSVFNRQRKTSVDTLWLQEAADRLAQEVSNNLAGRPASHLTASQLKALSGAAELSVVLVSNQSIRKLNRQWRGKDSATDVLSFPLSLEAPPAGLPFELGEIFISVEKAAEQADSFGHDLERELAFLFVHGTLHVLGFDHETAEEEKEMFSRQKEILVSAGFKR